MELALFEAVAEACRGLVPPDIGVLRLRPRSYGLKAWFGPTEPPRAHYEVQVIGSKLVPEAEYLAVEIGFHLEHRTLEENEAELAVLVEREASWRKVLGPDAIAGPFLGRPEDWRRVSETWADPDLGDPDLAMDLAFRLTDYLTAIEPLRSTA